MKKTIFFLLFFIFSTSAYTQSKPYVIVVSFDAFRWDYTARGITPNLKSIEENGVSALSLRPSFPSKTFPNHIAIITGMQGHILLLFRVLIFSYSLTASQIFSKHYHILLPCNKS